MFPVLPYRRRSILNSAAQPAYPSASAVPVISASACLPACLPASFTIRCLSRPGGSFHLFSALISSYFFLSHINLSEPAWAARLFVHVCMCQLSFSICLWTQRGHFRQPPPRGFCSASCAAATSYFIAAAHFDFPLFQRAAEFDISFNRLSVRLPSVLDETYFF